MELLSKTRVTDQMLAQLVGWTVGPTMVRTLQLRVDVLNLVLGLSDFILLQQCFYLIFQLHAFFSQSHNNSSNLLVVREAHLHEVVLAVTVTLTNTRVRLRFMLTDKHIGKFANESLLQVVRQSCHY